MEYQDVLVKMDKPLFFPHISPSFSILHSLNYTANKQQQYQQRNKKAALHKDYPNFSHTPLPTPPLFSPQ